jgi:hypothetical protein
MQGVTAYYFCWKLMQLTLQVKYFVSTLLSLSLLDTVSTMNTKHYIYCRQSVYIMCGIHT